jgi:5'-methylthioadenosine phosphorylase
MKLGIIGGSGLYDIEGLKDAKEINTDTPFGKPSDSIMEGELCGTKICFLPRHGKGHRILPGELNHKANIFALKKLGVTHILSISAVGSLREDYAPRDVVIVDQYFDRTKSGLAHTFFGDGIVAHVSLASPVCPELSLLAKSAAETALAGQEPKVHMGGCYLNMEGPAFSTKAESKVYRSWGMDIIGMTNLGEARLAREAEICYSTVAMVTDYDCWHPDHDHVTVDMIIGNFTANVEVAKRIIKLAAERSASALQGKCHCGTALAGALITARDRIPADIKTKLAPIIGKYVS